MEVRICVCADLLLGAYVEMKGAKDVDIPQHPPPVSWNRDAADKYSTRNVITKILKVCKICLFKCWPAFPDVLHCTSDMGLVKLH